MLRTNAVYAVIMAALSSALASATEGEPIKPTSAGFRITENARLASGVYHLEDPDERGAIIISGDNLTVDLSGVTLVGSAEDIEADAYIGRGIVIRGSDVTLKGVAVRGYKVGIYAEDSPNLTITGCDLSRNYRQRLKSTLESEDLDDWLWGHENDSNEWLRYGAGIYLLRCPRAKVIASRARNGQNGLCISRCHQARIVDNDMSFMSGWGLAMWRCRRCEVFNNKFDWCIRGYSHGVYSRGQDSAGILVYEQCSENVFAYNSATHSGDGFFLYAGNETLRKTGRGGCNRNIVYHNDFSHAAANGIEATFSEGNIFIGNILRDCTHGVWAGYSHDTIVQDNTITDCTYGVSIEHGRRNRILKNSIADTRLGVNLWWDEDKDLLASPFCREHDECRSGETKVADNRFERVQTAIRVAESKADTVLRNIMTEVDTSVHLVGQMAGTRLALTDTERTTIKDEGMGWVALPLKEQSSLEVEPVDLGAAEPRLARRGTQEAFLPEGTRRGRQYILVDEWGPYDFTDVRVFPSKIHGSEMAALQVLGPGSKFQVTRLIGRVDATPREGVLPCKLTITATDKGIQPFRVNIDTDGRKLEAEGVLFSADWQVAFHGWSYPDDPRGESDNWRRIITTDPLDTMATSSIDFTWAGRAPSDRVPADYFATVAITNVLFPAGTWRFCTLSDDGVRVFLDGKEVIRNWTWHALTLDEADVEVSSGWHDIRIEHFEIDGYAQLRFWIEPVEPRRTQPPTKDRSFSQAARADWETV